MYTYHPNINIRYPKVIHIANFRRIEERLFRTIFKECDSIYLYKQNRLLQNIAWAQTTDIITKQNTTTVHKSTLWIIRGFTKHIHTCCLSVDCFFLKVLRESLTMWYLGFFCFCTFAKESHWPKWLMYKQHNNYMHACPNCYVVNYGFCNALNRCQLYYNNTTLV